MSNLASNAHIILIAIDDGFLTFDVEAALQHAGYGILGPARHALDAIDLLNRHRPAAALVSVRSADKHTRALLDKLQDMQVPFAFVGPFSSTDATTDKQAYTLFAPFSDDVLLALLRQMIAQTTSDGAGDAHGTHGGAPFH